LLKGAAVGAGAVGAGLMADTAAAGASGGLTRGDAAILRFLAAAEILETDMWQQYNELAGIQDSEVPGGSGNPAYTAAVAVLDEDMAQYIHDNTDDEISHFTFINAYLKAHGAKTVNLDKFRTLPSSKATGAQQIGRLTNLMKLNVDTSWYTRYRSTQNPDFGATFSQAVNIMNEPAIPLNDADTPPGQPQPVPPATPQQARMQAIANTAGFHFATFDQAGSSLYTTLSLKVTDPEVLRIVVSILGVEVNHFAIWHDKAGNAVSKPLAGVIDPETGVTFPDLDAAGSELFQTNLIMPEPCEFIKSNLPACAVIRPSLKENAGAVATATAVAASQLFFGQSQAFFDAVIGLAMAADAAQRR
jgi:hypothetical protein